MAHIRFRKRSHTAGHRESPAHHDDLAELLEPIKILVDAGRQIGQGTCRYQGQILLVFVTGLQDEIDGAPEDRDMIFSEKIQQIQSILRGP